MLLINAISAISKNTMSIYAKNNILAKSGGIIPTNISFPEKKL